MSIVAIVAAAAVSVAADYAPLHAVVDAYPALSPDGRTLLFQSNRSGRWAIHVSDPDGRNVRVLVDSGDDPSTPVWSPDGASIAFSAGKDGETDVFTIRSDGTGRRRLASSPGDDSHPHWSADGERIYFNSARVTPDLKADWARQWHNVFSMRRDGSDLRQHTRCQTVCTYPVPSPDGRRIAYRKIVDTPGFDWALRSIARNSEVFVADVDGSNEHNLTNHAAYDGWPMWSPDGEWIAFASNRGGQPNMSHLYVVRPDGKDVRQVTRGSGAFKQHSWAADGRSVLAARTWEADDWSWEYGHIVRIPVEVEAR
jgi:TolB protein